MRTLAGILLLGVILTLGCSARLPLDAAPSGAVAPARAVELTAMTFNLRYAHTNPPNLWPERRDIVREVIDRWRPDVVGTQEGLYHQLVDMAADLPTYRWIGTGRDGGSAGEFMAVFYRHDRLELVAWDHFWLSDTPDRIGSKTWGNRFARMVTWVRFRDRLTGDSLIVVNTHFDHESQPSRERSAELIVRRAAVWDSTVPVILLGDFNVPADNRVHAVLTGAGGFRDSWQELHLPDTLATYHDFKGTAAARGGKRIDWVLVRGPVQVLSSEIVTHARGAQYPSDHFPVVARLALPSDTGVRAGSIPGSAGGALAGVQRLSWLAGCWERQASGLTTVEQWGRPRGGNMLGTSHTTRGAATVEFEQLRLYERGDTLVYAAWPSGQRPAEFASVVVSDTSAAFENPAHDFPQRIIYRWQAPDSLLARIEGVQGGARRGIDFRYRRVACP